MNNSHKMQVPDFDRDKLLVTTFINQASERIKNKICAIRVIRGQ